MECPRGGRRLPSRPPTTDRSDATLSTHDEGTHDGGAHDAPPTTDERPLPEDEVARFASVASHDLRNSLATLRGFLDLVVEEEQFGEHGEHLLQRAFDVSDRMRLLVDSIGEYGRARRQPLEPETIDLDDAVKRALRLLEEDRALPVGAVDITGTLPAVHADAEAVVQILGHVLDNALRYTADDTPHRATVGATASDDTVTLVVEDAGPGLPPGTETEIFQPFEKTVNSRGHSRPGLGLATVRVLVERSGGTVRAETIDPTDGGTRLVVELPRA